MSNRAAECQRYADSCLQQACEADSAEVRDRLLYWAQWWLRRADRAAAED
jgi:hypothetical protein